MSDEPIRILLIDDHASTREPLAFMLNQEPDLTVVAQAGSLAEARVAIDDTGLALDLAIIDLGLPDGDGEELIVDLRSANRETTALVLTYFSEQDRLARAVAAGAAGVLHKSAPVQEVIDAVRRLHAGEQLVTVTDVIDAIQRLDLERQRDRERHLTYEQLTQRELDVLQALAEGLSDKDISERFQISAATVRTHVNNILTKLYATSRLQALVTAVRNGIVEIA
ncbi:MAG TPA: response regulator transcription factor [Thermomicrobiales bacterium]|nr:response regulator transcription factor [Thermomicrobiales bacterium]